jgi:hypothetical protein
MKAKANGLEFVPASRLGAFPVISRGMGDGEGESHAGGIYCCSLFVTNC